MAKINKKISDKKFDDMSARVIDADNNKILEWFDPSKTFERVKYYELIGKWNDVSVDCDGDIILWEE